MQSHVSSIVVHVATVSIKHCWGITFGELVFSVANDHARLTDRTVADYNNFDLIILWGLGLSHL